MIYLSWITAGLCAHFVCLQRKWLCIKFVNCITVAFVLVAMFTRAAR